MTETTQGLGILNSAEVFTIPKEEAVEKFKEYGAAVKRSRSAADKLLAQTFKALSEGFGVININEAIMKGGVNQDTSLPFLAVSRADEPVVWFQRSGNRGCFFGANQQLTMRRNKAQQQARRQWEVPEGMLASWHALFAPGHVPNRPEGYWRPHRAPVPTIPPQFRPADAKSKYLIMWEVEKWEMVVPVDPMLLRPLAGGLAVVVAHWDLSPVERMVLGSLLGQ